MATGGLLYAIQAEGTSLVKIGYTTGSVEKRLKTLQTGQPFRLRVIETVAVESEAQKHETLLHTFLTEQRRSGEWFEIDLRDKSLSELLTRAIQWGAEQEAQRQDELDARRMKRMRGAHPFGLRVRAARERLGLSREELTQQLPATLRMHPNTLWAIEVGQTHNPRADQLIAFATVFNVSIDYLVGLTDDPTPPARKASL